jgi:hypothetical protein
MTIEPVIVAAIAAVSGIVSGLVVSLVKPWGENWRDVQRDRRARRDADLDALKDNLNQWADKAWVYPEMRSQAAAIGDSQLIAHIGRVITVDNPNKRQDAVGDAMHRIGELRHRL